MPSPLNGCPRTGSVPIAEPGRPQRSGEVRKCIAHGRQHAPGDEAGGEHEQCHNQGSGWDAYAWRAKAAAAVLPLRKNSRASYQTPRLSHQPLPNLPPRAG